MGENYTNVSEMLFIVGITLVLICIFLINGMVRLQINQIRLNEKTDFKDLKSFFAIMAGFVLITITVFYLSGDFKRLKSNNLLFINLSDYVVEENTADIDHIINSGNSSIVILNNKTGIKHDKATSYFSHLIKDGIKVIAIVTNTEDCLDTDDLVTIVLKTVKYKYYDRVLIISSEKSKLYKFIQTTTPIDMPYVKALLYDGELKNKIKLGNIKSCLSETSKEMNFGGQSIQKIPLNELKRDSVTSDLPKELLN